MLAEQALQSFAERIVDDLPEDLAVLSELQMQGFASSLMPDSIEPINNKSYSGDDLGSYCKHAAGSDASNVISLEGFVAESNYQMSFSQH